MIIFTSFIQDYMKSTKTMHDRYFLNNKILALETDNLLSVGIHRKKLSESPVLIFPY